MKEIILVMDEDQFYSKKFCNQANKLFGKKHSFISFKSMKLMKEYTEENDVHSLVISENIAENIDDLKVKSIYILNEKDKNLKRVGKKNYIFKLQNIKKILEVIDSDIESKSKRVNGRLNDTCRLILYYSPIFIKNKYEIVKRLGKYINKKKKVLIVDIDEFKNYKKNVGLSNIIYNYKEKKLEYDDIKREIIVDKDVEIIESVTYPEDFNVISNIDLANIMNEIMKLGYDYIFVNTDMSYVKSQYLLNDADAIILMDEKNNEKVSMFKSYLKNENQIELNKITIFDINKLDRAYLSAFCKQNFLNREED